jgi:adenine/guanine phosphoribosyltransferase-like PRPP-binding protein
MIYHTTVDSPPAWADGTMHGTFLDLEDAVMRAVRTIEPRAKEFDVIAVQGVSGMSIGFPTALKLGMRIVVVRKSGEDSHCGRPITGLSLDGETLDGKRCLFMDDFVSGGTTRQRVRQAVEAAGGKLAGEYTSREDSLLKL